MLMPPMALILVSCLKLVGFVPAVVSVPYPKVIPKVEIPAAAIIYTSLNLHKKIEPYGSNSYNVSSAPTVLLNRAVLLYVSCEVLLNSGMEVI